MNYIHKIYSVKEERKRLQIIHARNASKQVDYIIIYHVKAIKDLLSTSNKVAIKCFDYFK